jgi:putative ABC transport system permease protein
MAVTLGVAVATAMIAVGVDVGDKINRELRSYGANIVVYPQDAGLEVRIGDQEVRPATAGAHLKESDLPNIKGMFWGHNVLAFTPFLQADASVAPNNRVRVLGTYFDKQLRFGTEEFKTGVEKLYPWWKVEGSWPPDDGIDVLVGKRLAEQLNKGVGEKLELSGIPVRIAGILSTGGAEDSAVIAPLGVVQKLANAPNAVDKIYVSALTKPEDAFARRNPDRMTPADRDRWYCSPYANSIAFQLQEVFPGAKAEQIRQAAQNEGTILSHISGLMLLIAIAALIAAALAVSAAMLTTIIERRQEIGLMKSLGATAGTVAALFISEAGLLALGGGVLGFVLGELVAQEIGQAIFHSGVEITPVLLPVVMVLAVLVTVGGSAGAIRRALKLDPVVVLRGEA